MITFVISTAVHSVFQPFQAVCFERSDNPGLLRLPHPASGDLHRAGARGAGVERFGRFEQVRTRLALRLVVQHEVDEIEVDRTVQLRREIMKKRTEVAVRNDRFGHVEQCAILIALGHRVHFQLRFDCRFTHRMQEYWRGRVGTSRPTTPKHRASLALD